MRVLMVVERVGLVLAIIGMISAVGSCQKSGTEVGDTYTIIASAGDGGSIKPEGAIEVPYGADQRFTISPDYGYKIEDVLVDGGSVGPVNEYVFSKVVEKHTIAASFAEKTVAELVSEGWEAYGGRDYQTAVSLFSEAVARDAEFVDAHNGSGWSNAKLNNLTAAAASFTTGLSKDSSNLEMKAGLAFVYSAQKSYSQSSERALQVVQTDSNWLFSRDLSLSADDLQLLLAENYFAEARYDLSLQRVQRLNSSFTADVATVAGRTALAQEIERLRTIV